MPEDANSNTEKARQKWDSIYARSDRCTQPVACEVLREFGYLLPAGGTALDVACGLGGNAFYLAARGFNVTAIDVSAVAIESINHCIESEPINKQSSGIHAVCESVSSDWLSQGSYDVIVVSRYLDRSICNALMNALNPLGLLYYQTFTRSKVNAEEGPSNPDYLLATNELLSLFSGLTVIAFSDQGRLGAPDKGFRNQSYLVAQKAG